MGIKGLLRLLEPIQNDMNLDKFKNKKAGIDISIWIHSGKYFK